MKRLLCLLLSHAWQPVGAKVLGDSGLIIYDGRFCHRCGKWEHFR